LIFVIWILDLFCALNFDICHLLFMPIFIYNSLSRKKEPFAPQSPPKVNIYTCGVTVYDECHIGHARSLYIFDVIRRYLEYRKFKVNFVRNITDIDDKIINRAKELSVDWRQLVEKYINSYYKDLELLGIQKGIVDNEGQEPRAAKNIPDMIKYIEILIGNGYAYVTDSGVYFSVRKFKDYGKLSGQGIDQMLSGVRIEPDENKRDPLDFALWKKSKQGEPMWEAVLEIKISDREYEKLVAEAIQNNDEEFFKLNKINKQQWKK